MEKATTKRSIISFQYLVSMLSLVKSGWITLFFTSGLISVLNLTIPIYMLHLIDNVFMTRNLYNLPGTTAVAFIAIMFQWALYISRTKLISAMAEQKLPECSPFALMDTQQAELMKNQITLILELFWMPIFIAALILMHPALGVFAIISASVMFGLMYYYFNASRSDDKHANHSNLKYRSLVNHIKKFRKHLFLKTSFYKYLKPEQRQHLEKYNEQNERQTHLTAATNGVRLIFNLGMFAIGATLVINNSLSPGSVIVGPLLLNLVLQPVMKLKILAKSKEHSNYNVADPLHRSVVTEKSPKRLHFSSVSHILMDHSEPIFQNINSTINLNGTIVISSENNNEKNILSELIAGVYASTNGKVYYDFSDGLFVDAEELNYPIAYLPEQIDFIYGTVMENLQLHSEVTENEIILKATEIGFHEHIMRLPSQYETIIDPNNMTLSASDQRMLGWVQLFVQKAPLIVIDGPELFLDLKFRKQIKNHLKKIKDQGIVVILMTNSKYFSSIATQLFGINKNLIKPLISAENIEHLGVSYEQQG